MNAIMLVNENLSLQGLSKAESKQLQINCLTNYMKTQHLKEKTLNPYQLNPYYTIPHALFYDIKETRQPVDYLLIHSYEAMQSFISMYPARWILLKSFFRHTIYIEDDSRLADLS
ncbi:MAG: hypothetical protein AB2374_19330 [Cytobacillus gottheilii]|uniref:hypothetical protein n=1 Tax=Cytobacillus gottheilii TaxID=859144 RepID=UPI000832A86C|nr:hypothetical protein [Cytobacillus gottheilii]